MKKRILSIISGLILISLFAVSCSDKKGTDPTTTPNKGIQTYQGDWKIEGKDINGQTMSGTINIDANGTITGNAYGIIGPGDSITKDKITDKGNETYEINMSEYNMNMIYEFTFANNDSGTWKVFVSLNGNKQESASGTLTRQ
ncbi:hypothetical protein R4Q14_13675 [Brachyspira intermedia]|uniref:hypothetical protein n=1 Tax=Brachyspira intermedia TaxID=84377 RepID=UPI0030067CB8